MKIIAITGRSGCGKSSVTKFLVEQGYPCVDADAISHEIWLPGSVCLKEACACWGEDLLDEQGQLRRRVLADRAFATPEGTAKLTSITHPEIFRRMDEKLEAARSAGAKCAFVDGAVIIGTPFEKRCDRLVLIAAPYEQSVARICARDGIAPEMARRRLDAQIPEAQLREKADYIIDNNSTPEELHKKCEAFLVWLRKEENES